MRGNVHKVTLTPHNAALLHHKAALFQYNVRLLADVFFKLTACHSNTLARKMLQAKNDKFRDV